MNINIGWRSNNIANFAVVGIWHDIFLFACKEGSEETQNMLLMFWSGIV